MRECSKKATREVQDDLFGTDDGSPTRVDCNPTQTDQVNSDAVHIVDRSSALLPGSPAGGQRPELGGMWTRLKT